MEMVKQEMEMELVTIVNGNVKENHGFIHDFPWNYLDFLSIITIPQIGNLVKSIKVLKFSTGLINFSFSLIKLPTF